MTDSSENGMAVNSGQPDLQEDQIEATVRRCRAEPGGRHEAAGNLRVAARLLANALTEALVRSEGEVAAQRGHNQRMRQDIIDLQAKLKASAQLVNELREERDRLRLQVGLLEIEVIVRRR